MNDSADGEYIMDIGMWKELYPRITRQKVDEAVRHLDTDSPHWRSEYPNDSLVIDTIIKLHPELTEPKKRARSRSEQARYRKGKKNSSLGFLLLLIIIIVWFVKMAFGGDAVTNWVRAPSSLRRFGTNIYDTSKWPSTSLPFLDYDVAGYSGVPGSPVLLSGHSVGSYFGNSVSFENFRYDPKDFTKAKTYLGVAPVRQLTCKALLVRCHTNWSGDGQSILSVDTIFNCGEPVTNLTQVVTQVVTVKTNDSFRTNNGDFGTTSK